VFLTCLFWRVLTFRFLADVEQAKAGDSIGIKVTDRVRAGDTVYKITE